MTFKTRFAPSPTGPLHLGHAYSAILAYRQAQAMGGRFLLRIEDIDQSRSRLAWDEKIFDDLQWLGLDWTRPVLRQSSRSQAYQSALKKLQALGVIYACNCRRADIEAAASAPQEGVPQFGPDGRIYPGTCRHLDLPMNSANALRLDLEKALNLIELPNFTEVGPLHNGDYKLNKNKALSSIGDVILSRQSMGSSYHLSVVVDDAFQQITQVTRGADLWEATEIHVILQSLLGLPTPVYHHHDLIRDEAGKRLAKRDDAKSIATFRRDGASPQDILQMINLAP